MIRWGVCVYTEIKRNTYVREYTNNVLIFAVVYGAYMYPTSLIHLGKIEILEIEIRMKEYNKQKSIYSITYLYITFKQIIKNYLY